MIPRPNVIAYGTTAKPAAQYAWDVFGNLLQETSPRGTVTNNVYGYPSGVSAGSFSGSVAGDVTLKSNAFALGELLSSQDSYVSGGVTYEKTATSYGYYEPSGLLQYVEGPQPGTSGASAIVTAAYTYDALGDLLTVTAPGPNSTPSGNPSSLPSYVTTTLSYTTDSAYTTSDGTYYAARSQSAAINQPLSVTDPLGHVTHLRYDSRGNTTSATDPLLYETQTTYNIDDRPLSVISPKTGQSGSGHGGTLAVYLYDIPGDAGGNEQYGPLSSAQVFDEGDTGGAFRTVSYAYGKEGETLSVSGDTEPATYTYDALYRLSALADGGGNATKYFYNTAGYLYQVAYPLSGATTSPLTAGSSDTITYTGYDADGDVLSRVDGNGTTTSYTYNTPDSLLTNVHYTLPSSPPSYISSLADTSYTYDGYGRKAGMADATGSQTYGYDDRDALTSDATTYTGLSAKTVSYAFDPDGSRSGMTTPAGTFSYAYDSAGRMTSLTNPFSETTGWGYLNNDWLQTRTMNDGAVTTDTYDAKGETTDQKTTHSGTTLADFASPSVNGYDGAGDRLAVTVAGSSSPGSTSYAYDARDELTGETSTRGSGYTNVNHYDGYTSGTTTGPGNPTTLRGTGQSFNADNELTGTGFAYEGDGSPKTYKGSSLVFDPEGRMTAYGSAQTDGYRGDGLRAWKQTGGVTTYFLYDGSTPVCEMNSSGTVTATDTFGADGLVSRHTTSSAFYVFDPTGNVSERLTSTGTVASTDLVDGFGLRTTTDTTHDPFAFSGQWGGYYDAETGLVLLTYREYDPQTGRWLTRDPVGYVGGVNLYGYCRNQPVDWGDPRGLDPDGNPTDTPAPPPSPPFPGKPGLPGWPPVPSPVPSFPPAAPVPGHPTVPGSPGLPGTPVTATPTGVNVTTKCGTLTIPYNPKKPPVFTPVPIKPCRGCVITIGPIGLNGPPTFIGNGWGNFPPLGFGYGNGSFGGGIGYSPGGGFSGYGGITIPL